MNNPDIFLTIFYMNIKKFVIASIIIFIIALVWNGIVHTLLTIDESVITSLFRKNMLDMMWLSLLLTAVLSVIFVFGYIKFTTKGTAKEGIYYGFMFGVLACLLVDVNQYILYPLPLLIVIKWAIFGILEFTLYGFLVSKLYKK